ncbi:tail Collar domain-containing protein [Arenicella chitinivorans]|uniref:Tail Collar domain-containing protein n=1 Tax=Arenicella chitinivorans TaxID=1329800 RepID=A0A918RW50_9GAMM|nr:tail fiber protein [Arenicella chitinivorans]GHA13496.1 tail Collar domain-containing protein [Arenicella chitinivorans]
MSEPFIAEIRIFAGNFAPRGWALCNGQLLPISQNTALFSLIGTTYGGDGRSTTALPDLKSRVPMHPGHGPGLTSRRLGQRGGTDTVTLSEAQIPNHNHTMRAGNIPLASVQAPTDQRSLNRSANGNAYTAAQNLVVMNEQTLPSAGGSQAHNNQQPFLAMNFIIALAGLYPSRS